IARKFGGRSRNFTGESFWARGYFVSTVGLDEAMVRAYIRNQEQEDERYDQMKLGVQPAAFRRLTLLPPL
ncbi:MAG TPA: transposase, partial [Rhodanobacter sp.]